MNPFSPEILKRNTQPLYNLLLAQESAGASLSQPVNPKWNERAPTKLAEAREASELVGLIDPQSTLLWLKYVTSALQGSKRK